MKFIPIFMTLFLFANCDSTRQTQYNNPNAPFDTVLESDYGGNDEKSYAIITSKSDLKKEIAGLTLDEATINRLNAVDFRNQVVLSLHMGTRNTGGYGIKVSDVEINGNTTFVDIQETSPGPGEMVTMALTQPFCLVIIDANENIVFK
jgi:hypothetical protein